MTDPVTPEPGMQTWHSPHGTTWEAETYEEALEAERDSLAAQLEAAEAETERIRRGGDLDRIHDLSAQLEEAQKRERQLREALEGVEVFYPEALTLIRELVKDAQKVYEPEKGWPPHIEQALNLGDHDETLAQVRAALAANYGGATKREDG